MYPRDGFRVPRYRYSVIVRNNSIAVYNATVHTFLDTVALRIRLNARGAHNCGAASRGRSAGMIAKSISHWQRPQRLRTQELDISVKPSCALNNSRLSINVLSS